ncbi:MAG: thioredoxin family protein [Ardenticatenaceae bacterium]
MQTLITVLSVAILLLFVGMWGTWKIYKARLRSPYRSATKGDSPVQLLLFTRPYCAICKLKQLPIVTQLKTELGDAVCVKEIDPTFQPEFAEQYGIMNVPSSFIFDGHGHLQVANYGFVNAKKLRRQLRQAITRRVG